MNSDRPLVSIVMGSASDLKTMEASRNILKDFEISHEIRILSAHRSPKLTAEYAESLVDRGIEVVIAGAGRSAHLAGVIASLTTIPVIGVPIEGGPLNGLDALYSIVQMPSGVPVGTMAIGSSGAKNAGIFAVQILSVKFPELRLKLEAYKEKLVEGVSEQDEKLAGDLEF